jgi:long-chain acyl-CoA synthetase
MGWGTAANLIRRLGGGLLALGFKPGDRLAIVSETRREWLQMDLAAQAVRGVSVGAYASMVPEQLRYIIDHSESRFVVVEDRKQLVKIQQVVGELPRVEKIIIIDPAGAADGEGIVMTLAELADLGESHAGQVEAMIDHIGEDDAATFVYTSGTTGPPKAAVITHGNIVANMKSVEVLELLPADSGLSFLPLAHILQRCVDYRSIYQGLAGYYVPSVEALQGELRSAAPSIMVAVPRVFEKIYAAVHAQAEAAAPMQRRVFDWAVEVGRLVSESSQRGDELPLSLQIQYTAAKTLVFDKLVERMGGRLRLLLTGGAPIAKEILEFFDAAGFEVLEAWGLSETTGAATLNLPGQKRFGSVGKAMPGVELRLDSDGEILVRGPTVFKGYFKDDAATCAAFTDDGFFRTGDIGQFDSEGYLYIVDRKKDLIITAGGKKIPPQNLENALKQRDPIIAHAMAYGDRRPYLTALITLDRAQLTQFAKQRGLADDPAKLVQHPDLIAQVQRAIDGVNGGLASYESLKKFRILPREFTIDNGELTPTLKLKRAAVTQKYKAELEQMYS